MKKKKKTKNQIRNLHLNCSGAWAKMGCWTNLVVEPIEIKERLN